jgi:fatty-acyl-CoA synthase
VEDVLFEHPGVAEVVVLGVPDEELGEKVAAVVRVAGTDVEVSVDELRRYCRLRIARFKTPSLWCFVDAYPTTAAGKIQKFVLRDLILCGGLMPVECDDRSRSRTEVGDDRSVP